MNAINKIEIKSGSEHGLESRLLAWKALMAWKQGEGFIGEMLGQIALTMNISPQDRNLALEIALGVCRQQSLLEHHLKKHLNWSKTDKDLRYLLLVAIYQHHFLNQIPVYSIVDTAVQLANNELKGGVRKSGFVNAILRKCTSEKLPTPKTTSSKTAALRYSHPSWLAHKWVDEVGLQKACLRMKANNMNPTQWVRVRTDKISIKDVASQLLIEEVETRFETYLQVFKIGEVLKSDLFKNGLISFQDPSSHLVCLMLKALPGDKVIDLCAAPGGKTAWLLERGVEVLSCDLKPHRLEQMQDVKDRLGLNIQTQTMDLLNPTIEEKSYSHVLLDAPCSNLGVLHRRPEARWNVEMKDIRATAELQNKLLENAATLVAPGGVIVYSTCSPEPEETILVVEEFLNNNQDFELEPVRSIVGRRYVQGSYMRIFPAPGSLDGFFGARLVRKK